MNKSEIKAVFTRDLNNTTTKGQAFYHHCRRQMQLARRRKEDIIHVYTDSYKEAYEASMLLTHARNRFLAYVLANTVYGRKHYVVILLKE